MATRASALRKIRNFDEAIEALGGTGAAAQALGRSASQVCQWRSRLGVFPAEMFWIVQKELKRRGYTASVKLFGFAQRVA